MDLGTAAEGVGLAAEAPATLFLAGLVLWAWILWVAAYLAAESGLGRGVRRAGWVSLAIAASPHVAWW